MNSLADDLQEKRNSLQEFGELTKRILEYLQNVISSEIIKNNYIIYSSRIAGTTKYLRPINKKLFLKESVIFENKFKLFRKLLKQKINLNILEDKIVIDQVVYTIQQSIGAGLDLLVNPNSARKHVGNRFEELIRAIFTEMGISNKRVVLQIPYESDEGEKIYKCENDIVLSPYKKVKSTSKFIEEKEIIVSLKTTSKDRMGKVFIDKLLIERFLGGKRKILLIIFNDVQRKKDNNISYTLVSGLFMVYTKFLSQLEGVYYIDPPPNALKDPFKMHIKSFSDLISIEIKNLLAS
ncbi:MAG: hypothetical protein JST15_12315 [Bacteroidetes bacterium]|nr:hypothetical protein [Bacteroidota bacterium]